MSRNPPRSPWASTPRERRHRKQLALTLPDDARERLTELATAANESLSRTVERLIREATR